MSFGRDYTIEPGGNLWQNVPAPGGLDVQMFITGEKTNGAYCLAKPTMRDQIQTHVHTREKESEFILTGEPTITIGDKDSSLTPGGFIFMPINVQHSIACDDEWSCLGISVPAGFDECIQELSELTTSGNLTPDGTMRIQLKYGHQKSGADGSR